jgi:hypothetical protein
MKRSGATLRRSAWRVAAIALVSLTLGLAARSRPAYAAFTCVCDCNGDGAITTNELLTCVNFALGTNSDLGACPSGVPPGISVASQVTVAVIIQAVNIVLGNAICREGDHCGNGSVEAGEDCDLGGTCLGGNNAGTHCTGEDQCIGNGVCIGGMHAEVACAANSECPGGACVHCVKQGGTAIPGDSVHTCAANCTFETSIPLASRPACCEEVCPLTPIHCATRGASGFFPQPGADIREVVSIGKPNADGTIPLIIKAASVQAPAIPVQNFACACVRGVAAKTCGGTLFEIDGTPAIDCTPGFTQGDSLCDDAGKPPCAFVHGEGNSASGTIGCGDAGLPGVDSLTTQDDIDGSCAGGPSACKSPPVLTFNGSGPRGSALILTSTAIGTVTGSCANSPTFCTDTDPQSERGSVATVALTTGKAQCEFFNANGMGDNTICACRNGEPSCPQAVCAGPLTEMGQPFDCANVVSGSIKGMLATAFTAPGFVTTGDACTTNVLLGDP